MSVEISQFKKRDIGHHFYVDKIESSGNVLYAPKMIKEGTPAALKKMDSELRQILVAGMLNRDYALRKSNYQLGVGFALPGIGTFSIVTSPFDIEVKPSLHYDPSNAAHVEAYRKFLADFENVLVLYEMVELAKV